MEKFNPSDSQYKKIEDLPEAVRDRYQNVKGGFVLKSAINFHAAADEAEGYADETEYRVENIVNGLHNSIDNERHIKAVAERMLEDLVSFKNLPHWKQEWTKFKLTLAGNAERLYLFNQVHDDELEEEVYSYAKRINDLYDEMTEHKNDASKAREESEKFNVQENGNNFLEQVQAQHDNTIEEEINRIRLEAFAEQKKALEEKGHGGILRTKLRMAQLDVDGERHDVEQSVMTGFIDGVKVKLISQRLRNTEGVMDPVLQSELNVPRFIGAVRFPETDDNGKPKLGDWIELTLEQAEAMYLEYGEAAIDTEILDHRTEADASDDFYEKNFLGSLGQQIQEAIARENINGRSVGPSQSWIAPQAVWNEGGDGVYNKLFEALLDVSSRLEKSRSLRSKIDDPYYLPTYNEVRAVWDEACVLWPMSNDCPLQKEETEWSKKVFRKPIFEFWTQEYIRELADYTAMRVREIAKMKNGEPVTVLEVAAGDGRLSHFLRQELDSMIPEQVQVVATNGIPKKSEGGYHVPPAMNDVENIDQAEAIQKYQPDIILTSWMPMDVDFTADFRRSLAVQEYILIGYEEMCGKDWETYGTDLEIDDQGNTIHSHEGEIPPFERDGFTQTDLEKVEQFSFSPRSWGKTSVLSFRRGV